MSFAIFFHKPFQLIFEGLDHWQYRSTVQYFQFCFNHRDFFRQYWSVAFCKNVFNFRYSHMITSLRFMIFIILFYTKVNIRTLYDFIRYTTYIRLYINRHRFIVLWYVLLYSSIISANLLIYKFFNIEVMHFWSRFCSLRL